ncbi:outer membrane beta-barrel domain-containing protein [Colwellia sp. E2M01]|uniref:outer membrane beta-barrel domain-containing protein n=1 Tax=Colwellia sp. E2M01 TaxID=2841561 RepID=UPI001C0872DD|nr:outer membrane beta-barrel domain-containing protein [Colwellia sp. E2M01]MBU2870789.1 outer membrane beta-barrel domain-containing protein [Colwellia sp. E2M01]
METRFQRILLATSLSLILSISAITPIYANDNSSVDVDVEKRDVLEDILDDENFEIGVQVGIMSIEDFGSNAWVSAHFTYHISEFFYAKARYGQSEAGTTSFENLVNASPLLTDEQRELSYYGLNIGYNLMPGEVFLGRDFALNSAFSIELGAGTTQFAGDDKFTVNVGVNQRLFLTDWIAWDIGMSDYIFDTDIAGENKTTHNLNFTTGFAFYF